MRKEVLEFGGSGLGYEFELNSSLMNRLSLIMAREEDPEFRKFCAWLFSFTAMQVFSTEEIISRQL